MERFDDAQIGDKVYCRIHGFGEIVEFDTLRNDNIVVKNSDGRITFYFACGREFKNQCEPTLFYVDDGNNYAETRPKPTISAELIPIDTKVYVWNVSINSKCKRHFAGCNKHHYLMAFKVGKTFFTADHEKCITKWDNMELAEELIINSITYPIGTLIV